MTNMKLQDFQVSNNTVAIATDFRVHMYVTTVSLANGKLKFLFIMS